MEWLKAILEKAEIKEGKLDVDALMSTINAEAPKNVMPKAEYNNINKQLKEANDTIKDLKKNNSDNEELQKKIKEHEDTIKDLEKTHKKEIIDMKRDSAINQALIKAGAKDADIVSKIMDKDKFTVNEDGTIEGLEEWIKSNKESCGYLYNDTETKPAPYTYKPQAGGNEVDFDLAAIEAAIL